MVSEFALLSLGLSIFSLRGNCATYAPPPDRVLACGMPWQTWRCSLICRVSAAVRRRPSDRKGLDLAALRKSSELEAHTLDFLLLPEVLYYYSS